MMKTHPLRDTQILTHRCVKGLTIWSNWKWSLVEASNLAACTSLSCMTDNTDRKILLLYSSYMSYNYITIVLIKNNYKTNMITESVFISTYAYAIFLATVSSKTLPESSCKTISR